jgi:hypothetical protein
MQQLSLTKITQTFPRPVVEDVSATVAQELAAMRSRMKQRDGMKQRGGIQPGDEIALAVGSRGIANIATVVKTTVDVLKAWGAAPFIIPAMGSHGGGTAAGQAEVLASYDITAETMGCPVRSSMEVVELTPPNPKNRVFMDAYAHAADGVVLINRVKLHTDFHGPYESGLVKLSVIGLGKHRQALEIHSHGVYGLRHLIPWTSQQILASGKVRFGIALVENAYDETMLVKALAPEAIMEEEPKLLDISRANMPRLPLDEIDVLIIDRMGKDISGSGLDPNIIGRNYIRDEPEPERPRIKAITVHDLTGASHGNAVGLGLADVITRHLFDQIDINATNENTVTSTFLERGKIPVIAPDDTTAFAYAWRSCNRPLADGTPVGSAARILRIRDTLHLSELHASDAALTALRDRDGIAVAGDAAPAFDGRGKLIDVWD